MSRTITLTDDELQVLAYILAFARSNVDDEDLGYADCGAMGTDYCLGLIEGMADRVIGMAEVIR